MSRKFYYRHGGTTYGPVSEQELRQMASDGTLGKSDQVCAEDEERWYTVESVSGLISHTNTSSGSSRGRTQAPAQQQILTPVEELSGAIRQIRAVGRNSSRRLRTINVLPPRQGSSLGIAALVLGILAFLFCWVPLLGVITLPLSVLGSLMGIIGVVVALTRNGAGIGFPIAGTAVSLVALVVAFSMTSAMASVIGIVKNSADASSLKSDATNQKIAWERNAKRGQDNEGTEEVRRNSEHAPTLSTREKWAPAHAPVKQGPVQIQVMSAKVDYVPVNYPASMNNEASSSNDPLLLITVKLTNLSVTKKVDYRTWAGATMSFRRDFGTLRDNFDNSYKRVSFGMMNTPVGRSDSSSIFPKMSITDVLIFEPPIDAAKHLDLELPASNFGGTGMIRIRIPTRMVE